MRHLCARRRDEMLRLLPRLMADLESSGDYYLSIPPGDSPHDTWGVEIDPDGRERHRLSEEERKSSLANLVHEELAYVRSLVPSRLLDVGCGAGWFLRGVGLAWDRHGVEINQRAAEHAAQQGAGRIHVADAHDLPFEAAEFDVVFSFHVIEHLDRPLVALAEMRRVLRPGGVLIVGTPDFDSAMARRYRERFRLAHDPTHISLFSRDSLGRWLRDNGLTVERVGTPFWGTKYATADALMDALNPDREVSPAFPGNLITFYARKR